MSVSELFANHFWFAICLIGLAAALTYGIFHWSKFDEGYEQGEPADPERIAKDNPPDEWSRSHWTNASENPSISSAGVDPNVPIAKM